MLGVVRVEEVEGIVFEDLVHYGDVFGECLLGAWMVGIVKKMRLVLVFYQEVLAD